MVPTYILIIELAIWLFSPPTFYVTRSNAPYQACIIHECSTCNHLCTDYNQTNTSAEPRAETLLRLYAFVIMGGTIARLQRQRNNR